MNSPKKAPAAKTQKTTPTAAKSPCTSTQSLPDTTLSPDSDSGFFISPLREEPTDEEVRRLWRSGNDRDL
jgi:hypothetical protein